MFPPIPRPVLEVRGLTKSYGGLRPLRLKELALLEGERVSVAGFDAAAAEIFVGLVTGSTLPDTGEILFHGQHTASLDSHEQWLAHLDRLGLVSERAPLLEGMTLGQNLAVPFTLELDPLSPDAEARGQRLAAEVGIDLEALSKPVMGSSPITRFRGQLARAIALDPVLLIVEHATAKMTPDESSAAADDLVRVAAARRLAVIAITADRRFGQQVSKRFLTLDPATGELAATRRRWLRR
jgi:ABC-type transporter Mla maintaining outer membrane lipid asymmetry ATPase subunit MlaF